MRYRPCQTAPEFVTQWLGTPVDVWQQRYRKVLEPFFDVRDGHWFHKRIERELRNGHRRHTQTVAATEAANKARAACKAGGATPSRVNVTDTVTVKSCLFRRYARQAGLSANTLSRDRAMPNKHYLD
jgi:uncharacterized protein YdaU (DUF1376 family)